MFFGNWTNAGYIHLKFEYSEVYLLIRFYPISLKFVFKIIISIMLLSRLKSYKVNEMKKVDKLSVFSNGARNASNIGNSRAIRTPLANGADVGTIHANHLTQY